MQSFRFIVFTVFEIQGRKLNKKKKKKKKKKQKNWENELFVISSLLVMRFLLYFRCTRMLPIATHIESESLNPIFQMYGHDAEKPRPSLYTKYYRTL